MTEGFNPFSVQEATRIMQPQIGKLNQEMADVRARLVALEASTPPPAEPPGDGWNTEGLTRPPKLINPTVIEGSCPSRLEFRPDEDIFIRMPTDRACDGVLHIDGGRNIRVVGGHLKYAGTGEVSPYAIIRLGNIMGTIFFEGLDLDTNGAWIDGFGTFGPRDNVDSPTKIVIQNSYIHGINGRKEAAHGDIMEAFSGIDWAIFENVTGLSAHAGLFLPRRPANSFEGITTKLGPRNIRLYNVHLAPDYSILDADAGAILSRLLYMHDVRVGGVYHDGVHDVVTLDNVYVEGEPDSAWWKMVQPHLRTAGPKAILSQNGKSLTFPPEINIQGEVREGPPPGGTFVNPEDVGLTYSSPWSI